MTSAVKNVQSTLQENFGGFGHNAAGSEHQFSIDNVPDQTGRVAVVTGGSEGIGYGCTRSLLAKDIGKLYILSLSKEVVEGAYNAIKQDLGEESAKRTHWIQCDLSDWKQAANVAKEISNSTDRLDILINNAARGIMTAQLTDYGVDRHMALNHMGHVILTSHLLPLMKKTASANNKVRFVNLGSNAHEQVPKDLSFKNLEVMNSDLGPMGTYGRSKLAALLYSRYLARHLTKEHPNILANATHPGFVDTAMTDKHIHEPYPCKQFIPQNTLVIPSLTTFHSGRLRHVRRPEGFHERPVAGLHVYGLGRDLHRQERRVHLPTCDARAWQRDVERRGFGGGDDEADARRCGRED